MPPTPEQFARTLADPTRLRALMLLVSRDELCVCDFTEALVLKQPKISRHLAILREAGVVLDRRAGLWIHYRLHPDLPAWAVDVLRAFTTGSLGKQPFVDDQKRLAQLAARPASSCN